MADAQRTRAEEQTVVAGQQMTRAEQQTKVAEQQKLIADSQRQLAEREGAEAMRQKAQAEAARGLETEARRESERERIAALAAKEAADKARGQAVVSEAEATRLRMLAVARALSIQTTRMTSTEQRDLAALLAVQAFRLHQKNGGIAEDSQVFDALRSTLSRLDPATVAAIGTLPDSVFAVASAQGSNLVAAGGDDGGIWVADISGASPVQGQRLFAAGSEVRALAWVNGKRLAVGTLDGQVRIFDQSAPATPAIVTGPGTPVSSLAVGGRGNQLAIGTANGNVTVRPVAGGAARALKSAGNKAITALLFLPDGRLVGATRTGGDFVWNPERPDEAPRKVLSDRSVRSLAGGADGRIAAGTDEGRILLLLRGLDGPVTELTGHTSAVTSVRFSPDGTRLASASLDGTVRLWDAAHADREPIVLRGHNGWVWALDFAARGDRVVSGGADRSVRAWPTEVEPLAAAICQRVRRNLTAQEWREFAGDIALEPTCPAPAGRGRGTR